MGVFPNQSEKVLSKASQIRRHIKLYFSFLYHSYISDGARKLSLRKNEFLMGARKLNARKKVTQKLRELRGGGGSPDISDISIL